MLSVKPRLKNKIGDYFTILMYKMVGKKNFFMHFLKWQFCLSPSTGYVWHLSTWKLPLFAGKKSPTLGLTRSACFSYNVYRRLLNLHPAVSIFKRSATLSSLLHFATKCRLVESGHLLAAITNHAIILMIMPSFDIGCRIVLNQLYYLIFIIFLN